MSGSGTQRAVPLILFLLLIGTFLVYVPVNPSITVSFTIQSNSTTGAPTVVITSWTDGKQALVATSNTPKGQIVLLGFTNTTTFTSSNNPASSTATVTQTPSTVYQMIVAVKYGNETLSFGYFSVTVGLYQARVVYWPRTEQSTVPYTVILGVKRVSDPVYSGNIATIFPSP
jgi:hypothetical protein